MCFDVHSWKLLHVPQTLHDAHYLFATSLIWNMVNLWHVKSALDKTSFLKSVFSVILLLQKFSFSPFYFFFIFLLIDMVVQFGGS